MQDQPQNYPRTQFNGSPTKPLLQVLLDRRATGHFEPEPVPDEYLRAILQFTAQAPSGYNLQPWRMVIVRDDANRKRLMQAAFGQPKIGEAPVVVIFVGMKNEWRETAAEVFNEGAARGAGNPANVEKYMQGALDFLNTLPMDKWVNRHTMIAFTTMMLVAESYGFDTAPMEGFDAAAVKREFHIPDEGEVVALLAIGKLRPPDKPYTGRFELARIAFGEEFGQPLNVHG